MSGIVGIHYLDGRPIDGENISKMVDILAHRGPDGADIWVDGCVGLGHRMLWTTPESLIEKLPLVNQRGDLVITADARIDNRDELISALGLSKQPSEEITDSQLILSAYEKWQEECPQHLLGDFAFAIWDERKQKLFCARDPMGVKPFYYYRSDKIFIFASEIKALFCLPEVPRQLNELRVGQFLTRIFQDKAITFYKDIWRLSPAHTLDVSSGLNRLQSYYSLNPSKELRLKSNQEYAEAYREIFTEAVNCRLRSPFSVGSMLSGGLDSSSITCVARQLLEQQANKKLHTFSAIFPSLSEESLKQIDERAYVNLVLGTGEFIPHFVELDRLSPLMDYEQVSWHMDEATVAPNFFLSWSIYKEARQQGVRVLLEGIDGDTTVSYGQGYLMDLARTFRLRTLKRETFAFAQLNNYSPLQALWQWALQPLIPEPIQTIKLNIQGGIQSIWADNAINPNFAKRINLSQHIQELITNDAVPARTARQLHWHSLNSGLLPYALELTDKASAASSLSVSYPFCDHRLMEYCLAIPPEQKLSKGWTRLIARCGMRNILPNEVVSRNWKANLGVNFKPKLIEYERNKLDEFIYKKSYIIEDYIDISALRESYSRYLSEPMREHDAMAVYTALNLAMWLQKNNFY